MSNNLTAPIIWCKEKGRNTFSVNFTCRHITYIPNPQAIPLSPEGVNERVIGATCSTEQHTLFTDSEICYYSFNNYNVRRYNTETFLCTSVGETIQRIHNICICSHHFHVPWVHQVGFVAQNVPNLNVFVSWRGDQASFNLAAQVQTCRNVEVKLLKHICVTMK